MATYDASEARAARSTAGASGASWSHSTTASPARASSPGPSSSADSTRTVRPTVDAITAMHRAMGLSVRTRIRPRCTGSSRHGCSRSLRSLMHLTLGSSACPSPSLRDCCPRASWATDWAGWLRRLPRRTSELLEEWRLTPVATALHGYCSLVVPVVDADGVAGGLKVTFDGDRESLHEGLALQHWGGRGAVRLRRSDPHRRALLLDWLPGPDLGDTWDVEACEVVGGLYPRLHVPAMPQLATVASYVEQWLRELDELGRDIPVPRRYVDQALALGPDLLADASEPVVVHGDLHYANVMADDAGEWRAIDPKPMAGDPHYEPAPMLWNRMDELAGPGAVGSVRDGLRRRFHALVDAGGLDEDRARDWVVVRMVVNAGWTVQDARAADRALTADERDWITRCIAITKAVQD